MTNKMTFTEQDKLKALAIVNIFETSKPFGEYAAVAVLNDGAGVSYGFAQFTHRSGALCDVVERYLATGGQVGRDILRASMPLLRSSRPFAREKLATDVRFKKALRAAAVTREMKEAQHFVATEKYMGPTLLICARLGFKLPLSLAVVYDSMVHGSWERIASRVRGVASIVPNGRSTERQSLSAHRAAQPQETERAWITEYVRRRHMWLTAFARLKMTNYRTRFFLGQIAIGNRELRLPLTVHGVKLSEPPALAGGTNLDHRSTLNNFPEAEPNQAPLPPAHAGGSDLLATAASNFDRIDGVVTSVVTRTDRAKSLWTTVIGTVSQAAWAVFGFFAGLPSEVWIVVAVIAGALMLLFLYRQLVLGRIRETSSAGGQPPSAARVDLLSA